MGKRTAEEHLTWYVVGYYGRLMTKAEWLAYRALLAEGKVQGDYSSESVEDLRTSDPDALSLMNDGPELFMQRIRDRILRDHLDKVVFNYCPKCGGLAMTPRAQQCHWCFHDWHSHERRSAG
jgi:hypothetical protein